MGSHRAIGRMKGSLGAWGLDRSFAAAGAEALSPPVDERGFAAFLYRGGDVAARDGAVWRAPRSHAVHATERERSVARLH